MLLTGHMGAKKPINRTSMKAEKIYTCRTVGQSVRARYEEGKITFRQAAEELCRYGWTNFIDENYTRKILGI